ncbi:MAG: metal ABC transporter substrate-binding protein [Planctomycetota bacterium]
MRTTCWELTGVRMQRAELTLALAVLAVVAVGGCSDTGSSPDSAGSLPVAASIFPLADLARQVGGPDVEVATLLPPGTTPHGFEPKKEQAETLAASRLLVLVGLGMDSWAAESARAAAADFRVVRFADLVAEEPDHPPGHGHADHQHVGDPHLWLDPVRTKRFVRALAEVLAELDPDHASGYRGRAASYAEKLDELDADYRAMAEKADRKAFVSFHPAFSYLAERYGLRQETIVGPHGHARGAADMERVIEFVNQEGIDVIFAEPQFPEDKLRWLREQTGAEVGRLDPLGNPSVDGYDSYLAMMRSNLRALSTALTEGTDE